MKMSNLGKLQAATLLLLDALRYVQANLWLEDFIDQPLNALSA